MIKFYGNIETINCKYLLEATPFRIDPKINFSNQLSEEVFFDNLYKEASSGTSYKENELFNRKIADALKDVENEYAKVEMIHIAGYGGCGKTTFIRNLLWNRNRENKLSYDVIDYEGVETSEEPLLLRVSQRLKKLNSIIFRKFVAAVANEEILNMNRFRNCLGTISKLVCFLEENCEFDELVVRKYLKDQINGFRKKEEFLSYLLTLDFIMLLYCKYLDKTKKQVIIVIDNVDSLSDLHEESMLISVVTDFITNCNFFFGHNINGCGVFEGQELSQLIKNTKLVFFLTTRIATIKRYKELYPDLENLYGWNSATMPEHYYDHRGIIDTRIDYYMSQEDNLESKTVKELIRIRKLAEVAYSNYNFKRLFNGNIRFCVERLCDIVANYDNTGIIQQCLDLYKLRNKIPEAVSGANGMLLAMILTEFKNNGVYRDKLQLSECKQDDEVSLSRIILTVLREKGGRCSMLDLYNILSPFFDVDNITNEIWSLNESNRQIWRRLVLFNVQFPTDSIQLHSQGKKYKEHNVEITEYSEVDMCTSGNAYIEFVVPHFEFMLSRHSHSVELYDEKKRQPLFAESSEVVINSEEWKYRFEKKINWVFRDVHDCCYNSVHFSDRICEKLNMSREKYINNTFYNFMAQAQDGTARFKQSYESRLIFSHIGYIERYRRYLLKKHSKNNEAYLMDINERIINFIKKYLILYMNEETCYQTEVQNKAARELKEAIDKIVNAGYRDFTTKIETGSDDTIGM